MDQYQNVTAPVAQGDGPLWVPGKNPAESQLSVYGSGHAGIFGSIIKKTEVEGILQLNLLATDFFRSAAYPSYLYYNPHNEAKTIMVSSPKGKSGFYNTVTGSFVAKNSKSVKVTIPAKGSAVIVITPANGKVIYSNAKLLVNNVVVDYNVQKKK